MNKLVVQEKYDLEIIDILNDNGTLNESAKLYTGKDRFHPTQKSLVMFEELVKKHSNPGDLILDPFLGSGTTALAAKNLNRDFTGCEMDKDFFQKSLDRLEKKQ